jgi:hypothetical protein
MSDWYIKNNEIYSRYDPIPIEAVVEHCNRLEEMLKERSYREQDAQVKLESAVAEERMNLRDQFAMAALTGLVAGWPAAHERPTEISRRAYEFAAAMLNAREVSEVSDE